MHPSKFYPPPPSTMAFQRLTQGVPVGAGGVPKIMNIFNIGYILDYNPWLFINNVGGTFIRAVFRGLSSHRSGIEETQDS